MKTKLNQEEMKKQMPEISDEDLEEMYESYNARKDLTSDMAREEWGHHGLRQDI